MDDLNNICMNCRHAHPFEKESEYLQCRRNPPVPFVAEDGYQVWAFPCVTPYLYCGDFEDRMVE